MAEVNVTSVQVLNNPAHFTDPISLEVQYECLSDLKDDLEWRVIYVASVAEQYDQLLDSALVGPVHPGHYKFRMDAPAPDPSRIPSSDLLGMTALMLTCSYQGKEFVRVGWFANIDYVDAELLDPERPLPNPPDISKLQRNVLTDHPRVTKYPHDFDNEPAPMPEPEPEPADDDLLPEEAGDDAEEEEDDEDEEEEEGDLAGMAEGDVENLDPNGGAAAAAAGDGYAGKAAAASAGAEDMEL